MFSLLPPNSSRLEKTLEQVHRRVLLLPVPFIELNRIDDCPESHLPWLAWQERVEYWDSSWTVQQKRQAIHAAKTFNKQRGTVSSVTALIDTVVQDYTLTAWHQFTPKKQPYTFYVTVGNDILMTVDQLASLYIAVDATKSQRDFYSIYAKTKTDSKFTLAGAAFAREKSRIISFIPLQIHSNSDFTLAGAGAQFETAYLSSQ